jgi:hypothetical protein
MLYCLIKVGNDSIPVSRFCVVIRKFGKGNTKLKDTLKCTVMSVVNLSYSAFVDFRKKIGMERNACVVLDGFFCKGFNSKVLDFDHGYAQQP